MHECTFIESHFFRSSVAQDNEVRMDPCKVFLGQLHAHVTKETIAQHLQWWGVEGISQVHVIWHGSVVADGALAAAFITFEDTSLARAAVEILDEQEEPALSPTVLNASLARAKRPRTVAPPPPPPTPPPQVSPRPPRPPPPRPAATAEDRAVPPVRPARGHAPTLGAVVGAAQLTPISLAEAIGIAARRHAHEMLLREYASQSALPSRAHWLLRVDMAEAMADAVQSHALCQWRLRNLRHGAVLETLDHYLQ